MIRRDTYGTSVRRCLCTSFKLWGSSPSLPVLYVRDEWTKMERTEKSREGMVPEVHYLLIRDAREKRKKTFSFLFHLSLFPPLFSDPFQVHPSSFTLSGSYCECQRRITFHSLDLCHSRKVHLTYFSSFLSPLDQPFLTWENAFDRDGCARYFSPWKVSWIVSTVTYSFDTEKEQRNLFPFFFHISFFPKVSFRTVDVVR